MLMEASETSLESKNRPNRSKPAYESYVFTVFAIFQNNKNQFPPYKPPLFSSGSDAPFQMIATDSKIIKKRLKPTIKIIDFSKNIDGGIILAWQKNDDDDG